MRPPVIAENSIRSENTGVPIIREIMVATTMTMRSPYGEKTRPGPCPEPELIALRTLMINQAREVFCQGRFPASFVLIVSPSPAVPSTVMPLPSRNTSAGRPVVLDTALLPCSFLPPSAKETRSDYLCPDGCVRYFSPSRLDSVGRSALRLARITLPPVAFLSRYAHDRLWFPGDLRQLVYLGTQTTVAVEIASAAKTNKRQEFGAVGARALERSTSWSSTGRSPAIRVPVNYWF